MSAGQIGIVKRSGRLKGGNSPGSPRGRAREESEGMSAKRAGKPPEESNRRRAKASQRAVNGGAADQLTEKQKAFCAEFIVDLNAAKAAIRAGYSQATAKEIGFENLTKPHIQAEVQRLMDERGRRVKVNGDRVLQELVAMAFYDPADIASVEVKCPADIAKLPEDVRRAIVGWSWDRNDNFTLKLSGKTQQLEMIGRHLKLFTDKHEHTGADGTPLNQATTLSPEQQAAVARVRNIRDAELPKKE